MHSANDVVNARRKKVQVEKWRLNLMKDCDILTTRMDATEAREPVFYGLVNEGKKRKLQALNVG